MKAAQPEEEGKAIVRICINCHTENPASEVFCSHCGMSLTRAPTKDEMDEIEKELRRKELRRTWKDRTQPDLPLTASGLVYLFGEGFVKPGTGRFFGGQTHLVYSGHKVSTQRLAHTLFLAALVCLAEEGYVSLRVEKRLNLSSLPLIYTTVATITRRNHADDLPPSLESVIINALHLFEENRVPDVVGRVVSGGWLLGYLLLRSFEALGSTKYHWREAVVNFVTEGLAKTGYLRKEVEKRRFLPQKVHWSANESAIAPLAGEVETVRNTLEALRTANPSLYGSLAGELRDAWHGGIWE